MLHSFGVLLLAVAGLGEAEVGVTTNDAVLVEFSSKQCSFCEQMKPVVAELKAEGVPVRHVDVDLESEMAVRYGIRQLPTFVVISGGKESGRLVGMQPTEVLRRTLAASAQTRMTPTGAQLSRQAANLPPSVPQTRLQPAANVPAANVPAANAAPQATGNPQATPSDSLAAAVARAEAATVRLRVFEDVGYGVGTGTIIDAHGGEMLVLTCGHLFRESKGAGRIEVDVYHQGQVHTVPGQLVDYNADDRDIALVAIEFNQPIQPVPVLLESEQPRSGQSVFSFGCDRGADPSRRDTRITGINKYNQHLKLSNVEISGAPIDGRSGGGLFDDRGRLIGVCNAADYDDDIGIYAGPGEVYWQLSRVRLEHLFRGGPHSPGGDGNAAAAIAAAPQQAAPNQAVIQPVSATADQRLGGGDDREVIVIVRDRKNPDRNAQVVTFDTPPPGLLQMLPSGQ
ncbi:trypsin-like peptidase domain-containing protein [Candidatus Laterigemmans baculatus]|uniref:trypsin-like peptidase domain-containing protein n=1 Tax=Candidatus Laterigemmans baculatus TaxID=2770505 RepID=UPI0013DC544C|nr:trypsin-like peptidase domain-containing protein [Candidatus Laterigemmans baculatus]